MAMKDKLRESVLLHQNYTLFCAGFLYSRDFLELQVNSLHRFISSSFFGVFELRDEEKGKGKSEEEQERERALQQEILWRVVCEEFYNFRILLCGYLKEEMETLYPFLYEKGLDLKKRNKEKEGEGGKRVNTKDEEHSQGTDAGSDAENLEALEDVIEKQTFEIKTLLTNCRTLLKQKLPFPCLSAASSVFEELLVLLKEIGKCIETYFGWTEQVVLKFVCGDLLFYEIGPLVEWNCGRYRSQMHLKGSIGEFIRRLLIANEGVLETGNGENVDEKVYEEQQAGFRASHVREWIKKNNKLAKKYKLESKRELMDDLMKLETRRKKIEYFWESVLDKSQRRETLSLKGAFLVRMWKLKLMSRTRDNEACCMEDLVQLQSRPPPVVSSQLFSISNSNREISDGNQNPSEAILVPTAFLVDNGLNFFKFVDALTGSLFIRAPLYQILTRFAPNRLKCLEMLIVFEWEKSVREKFDAYNAQVTKESLLRQLDWEKEREMQHEKCKLKKNEKSKVATKKVSTKTGGKTVNEAVDKRTFIKAQAAHIQKSMNVENTKVENANGYYKGYSGSKRENKKLGRWLLPDDNCSGNNLGSSSSKATNRRRRRGKGTDTAGRMYTDRECEKEELRAPVISTQQEGSASDCNGEQKIPFEECPPMNVDRFVADLEMLTLEDAETKGSPHAATMSPWVEECETFEYLVVLDIKAACESYEVLHPVELIEFSCVLVEALTQRVVDSFQTFLAPKFHPQLRPFCVQLTGVEQSDVDNGLWLEEALQEFEKWLLFKGLIAHTDAGFPENLADLYYQNFCLSVWSSFDIDLLYDQCECYGIRMPYYFNYFVDIKDLFAQSMSCCFRYMPRRRCSSQCSLEGGSLQRMNDASEESKQLTSIMINLIREGYYLKIASYHRDHINSYMKGTGEVPICQLSSCSGLGGCLDDAENGIHFCSCKYATKKDQLTRSLTKKSFSRTYNSDPSGRQPLFQSSFSSGHGRPGGSFMDLFRPKAPVTLEEREKMVVNLEEDEEEEEVEDTEGSNGEIVEEISAPKENMDNETGDLSTDVVPLTQQSSVSVEQIMRLDPSVGKMMFKIKRATEKSLQDHATLVALDPCMFFTDEKVERILHLDPIEMTLSLFKGLGSCYYDENTTVLQHLLRAATLAEMQGRPPQQICAALVHDIGLLLYANREKQGIRAQTDDVTHETLGEEFLRKCGFQPSVSCAVLYHTVAEQYLEVQYSGQNDSISKTFSRVRGEEYRTRQNAEITKRKRSSLYGESVNTRKEVSDFFSRPYSDDALVVAICDHEAANAELLTPPIDHFIWYMKKALIPRLDDD
eukprot:Nk52_evm43s1569 gene=Nk52_evmTU43s1569